MRISELGEKIGQIVNSSTLTEEQKTDIQREFYSLMIAELDWDKQKAIYAKKVNEALIRVTIEEPKVEELNSSKGVRAVIKEEDPEEEAFEVEAGE